MTDLTGHSLGRYHILAPLGQGGMATVYKAYDTRLEREVAIKVIRVGQFGPDIIAGILKRFEREAKALARLTHPNIVHINDYGEHEGVPYLVMDYLPGGTLKERMKLLVSWQAAAKLLLPMLSALEYAHEQKIVHRDVKPANILLTQKGQPMLTDFGIAKLLETEAGQTLTGTGVGIGTPEYMAPEQGLGKQVDGRADLYALGIVLYELVTGRKPYTADTPMAVVFKHLSDPLPDPRQFVPDLPEGVARILFKALAKAPADRYPDAQAFAIALEKLLENQHATAPEKTTPGALPTTAALDAQDTIDGLKSITHDTITQNQLPPPSTPESQTPIPAPRTPIPHSQSWIIAGLGAAAIIILSLIGVLPQFFKPTPAPTTIVTASITLTLTQAPTVTFTFLPPSDTPTTKPRPTKTNILTAIPMITSTPSLAPTTSPTATAKLVTCSWTETRSGSSPITSWTCSCLNKTVCYCRWGYRQGPNDTTVSWYDDTKSQYHKTLSWVQSEVEKYSGSCH